MALDDRERIALAVQCGDCSDIPKVPGAGDVVQGDTQAEDYQIMHNGLKVFVGSHYGPFNIKVIQQLRGHHEPQEEKVFASVLTRLPARSVMLELGSWWAYYSMWFLTAHAQGEAYMIEPVPANLEWGKRNLILNGLTERGHFTNAAIGRVSSPQVELENWDGSIVRAESLCVDDIRRRNDIAHLDILHADIQGTEYDMLLGALSTLGDDAVSYVFISTHAEHLHQDCLALMKQVGHRVIAEHTPSESYSIDGLIATASPSADATPVKISKHVTFTSLSRKWRAKARSLLHRYRHGSS